MLSNFKQLKTNPGFLKLIIANVISSFGTSIDNIAFSWMVYELTSDPMWIAIIFGAAMFPMMVLQSLVAVWVEKQNKKHIIMIADLLGAVLMMIVAILYINQLLNPMLLLLITLINATIETVRIPAGIAIVPKVLSEENYEVGVGLNQSSSQIASLLGLAVTGTLIALFGLPAAFIVDALSFVLSFLMILGIFYHEELPSKFEGKKNSQFWKEYKEGIATLIKTKEVFSICCIGVFINFLATGFQAYSAIFIGDYLLLSVDIYSYSSIAITLGTIVGGLTSSLICGKIKDRYLFVLLGIIEAIWYFAWVISTGISNDLIKIAIVLMSTMLAGVSTGVISVAVSVNFMKAVPKEYLARIAGAFNSIVTISAPVAALFMSLLASILNVSEIFMVYGGISLLFAVILLWNKKTQ